MTNIINQVNQKYDDENNVDSNDSKEESLIPEEDEKEKESATDDIKININTANNPITEGIKMKGKTKLRDKKKK